MIKSSASQEVAEFFFMNFNNLSRCTLSFLAEIN